MFKRSAISSHCKTTRGHVTAISATAALEHCTACHWKHTCCVHICVHQRSLSDGMKEQEPNPVFLIAIAGMCKDLHFSGLNKGSVFSPPPPPSLHPARAAYEAGRHRRQLIFSEPSVGGSDFNKVLHSTRLPFLFFLTAPT